MFMRQMGIQQLKLHQNWVMQRCNDSKHTNKLTSEVDGMAKSNSRPQSCPYTVWDLKISECHQTSVNLSCVKKMRGPEFLENYDTLLLLKVVLHAMCIIGCTYFFSPTILVYFGNKLKSVAILLSPSVGYFCIEVSEDHTIDPDQ